MNRDPNSHHRLVQLFLLGLACLACTGGTFTCNDDDGDSTVVVRGNNNH